MARTANSPNTREPVVSRDPGIHSGDLVFAGTRVPVSTLIDYLKGGRTIEDFLSGFPSVERWKVEAYLDLSSEAVEHASGQGAGAA
jgi:uncharacterized protein (DUF433 family)